MTSGESYDVSNQYLPEDKKHGLVKEAPTDAVALAQAQAKAARWASLFPPLAAARAFSGRFAARGIRNTLLH